MMAMWTGKLLWAASRNSNHTFQEIDLTDQWQAAEVTVSPV
jgi:hypothetical protein